MTPRFLGLDLGGTNIKSVVVEPDAQGVPRVVAAATDPTYAERGPDGVTARLIEIGRRIVGDHGPMSSVGIGVPGLFEAETGRILLFPNLPGPWKGHSLRDPVAAGIGVPATIINDARAFTLAEGTIGAGRGCSILVCLTLGTGVGGGIMIGGRVQLGAFGRAGEVAHQTVLPDGPVCGCGNRGCAEALARADVLTANAGRDTVEEVYRGVSEGDGRCISAVEHASEYLGIALANVITLLGPDKIVIGGGISQAGDLVLDPIRRAVWRHVTLVEQGAVPIVAASLGSQAGAIGAALAGRSQEPVRAR